jgi:hypothetical protein
VCVRRLPRRRLRPPQRQAWRPTPLVLAACCERAEQLDALIDEKLGCHFAEPICRSSNKDTRHIYSPDTSFTNDSVIKQLRAFYCERASGSFDMIRHELDAPRQRPAYWQRVGGLDGVQAVLFVHTGS